MPNKLSRPAAAAATEGREREQETALQLEEQLNMPYESHKTDDIWNHITPIGRHRAVAVAVDVAVALCVVY